MAKKDLLAEAIADAKKVKSTALANAKIALEEAFQPTLQRMISTKLAEEDEFGDEDDDFDLNIEIAPEESEPEAEPVGMGSFEDEAPAEAPVDDVPADEPAPEGEEDLELEALIRELDGTDEEAPEDDMFTEGEEEDWSDPIQEDEGYDDEYSSGNNELTEAEVNALASLFEEEGLGDVDGPEDEDGGSYTASPTPEMNHESRKLRRENAQLKKDLNEAYRVVTSLKTTINEVNLLNAKLMFTTQALRVDNLSESQQIRIMQQIDRAKSVREVKLVYTTILEALNRKSTKRTVNEGMASKATNAITKSKKSLTETRDPEIIKWQRLAGIIPPADF